MKNLPFLIIALIALVVISVVFAPYGIWISLGIVVGFILRHYIKLNKPENVDKIGGASGGVSRPTKK